MTDYQLFNFVQTIDRKKMSSVKYSTQAAFAEYAEKSVNWLISLRSLRTLRATLLIDIILRSIVQTQLFEQSLRIYSTYLLPSIKKRTIQTSTILFNTIRRQKFNLHTTIWLIVDTNPNKILL